MLHSFFFYHLNFHLKAHKIEKQKQIPSKLSLSSFKNIQCLKLKAYLCVAVKDISSKLASSSFSCPSWSGTPSIHARNMEVTGFVSNIIQLFNATLFYSKVVGYLNVGYLGSGRQASLLSL